MKFINRLDAHHKMYIALAAGSITFFLTFWSFSKPVNIMVTWLAYCLTSLTLSWITILTSHPSEVKLEVHAQDSSRTLIFVFAVVASFVSLFAIVLLLSGSGQQSKADLTGHILLSLSSVISSWWLVHTTFTLRYAHLYYCNAENDLNGQNQEPGGLEFPSEEQPDYLDFTYFSYVIGMTFQVSDVQITSRRIRRLALMHGVLSFAFNTVIVALSINVIAGLIQK